jgi:hypothetical protein
LDPAVVNLAEISAIPADIVADDKRRAQPHARRLVGFMMSME